MRVAFYAPMKPPTSPIPSGDRRIARLIMTALEQGGHTPELISHFCSRDGRGDKKRQARLADLGQRLAIRLINQITARPKAQRPDAWLTYHLYHKAPDWLGPQVSEALGIPYFLAEASSAPKQAGGPWNTGYTAAKNAISRADGILVLNPDDQICLQPVVKQHNRLVSLRPFLDHVAFSAFYRSRDHHRAALRRRLGIPNDRPIILAVGMFRAGDKQASYAVLGHALAELVDLDWDLTIVGDGPKRDAILQALAQQLPAARTHAIGAVGLEKLPEIYAAADLLIWPAVREAIGMSILEAQATGLPVAAGDTGAIPTIVDHSRTGLLSPVGNANTLAAHVRGLLDDPNLRRRMGEAAVGKVAHEHTIEQASATMNAMFRQFAIRQP